MKTKNNFDQREALGVLEGFGEGNFGEIMDHVITSWQQFAEIATDYVPVRSRKKFVRAMKETFEEK